MIEILLKAPAEHPCYAGHFPGRPIVPGALLTHWIVQHCQHTFPGHTVTGIKAMKFLHVVEPGDECLAQFSLNEAGTEARVLCRTGGTVICKGTLRLAVDPAP
ncbi:MAG TPA: hypothetical protein ENJ19_09765 [Gammaproteobacteria bacterium]|nr:hypothetical protein [Gammaproteobacteria bacterium]